jgi:hypothetical protein
MPIRTESVDLAYGDMKAGEHQFGNPRMIGGCRQTTRVGVDLLSIVF